MITFENTETYGWEAAIRGMRNPMNSWDKSDTSFLSYYGQGKLEIGKTDFSLMKRLAATGNDHGKFLRMITVTADITAPLYWWKEYDTYKVGTVANSCSTMHKIQAKEFTLDDFSTEHLFDYRQTCNRDCEIDCPVCEDYITSPLDTLKTTIACLNGMREKYNETNDKDYWWQMIQLLPSSYNQRRTVQLNYAVLRNMYHARKNHKLTEWHEFCKWIETLPYNELIIHDT